MDMDTEGGRDFTPDSLEDLHELQRHGSAVCIAEDHSISAAVECGFEGFDRISRIGFVAIKKMLGIVDYFFMVVFQIANGIFNQARFSASGNSGLFPHGSPTFPEDRNDRVLAAIRFCKIDLLPVGFRVDGYCQKRQFSLVEADGLLFRKIHDLGLAPANRLRYNQDRFIKFFRDGYFVFHRKVNPSPWAPSRSVVSKNKLDIEAKTSFATRILLHLTKRLRGVKQTFYDRGKHFLLSSNQPEPSLEYAKNSRNKENTIGSG